MIKRIIVLFCWKIQNNNALTMLQQIFMIKVRTVLMIYLYLHLKSHSRKQPEYKEWQSVEYSQSDRSFESVTAKINKAI